jgi:hypothetical protein
VVNEKAGQRSDEPLPGFFHIVPALPEGFNYSRSTLAALNISF